MTLTQHLEPQWRLTHLAVTHLMFLLIYLTNTLIYPIPCLVTIELYEAADALQHEI